ncbi:flagellar M-ring protein [Synergistales bacterium]|nr:flagellar M-ring protein [Synergistales bacterium]
MENLRRLSAKFLLFWGGLKTWQKASLFAAVFLVTGLLALMVLWAGRVSYEPLYAGLEVNDQAAIVAYLKENNIPYQIDSIANAILLPRDKIYEARLTLAQEGLPKGNSTGFEIFDDSKMGMSEFQQKISYIRAREGELQRTIAQLDSVEFSKVSIIIPEERLFLAQQRPSTASVLLKLRPGTQLGSPQIKAILHLVSRSVDGLTPDNVTVVDTTGRILSDLVGEDLIYSFDGGNSVKSVQRDLERQREKEMELRVRQMLEQVFGPGSVSVRVTMDLDFDKISRSSREYYPNADTGQGIPRSMVRMEESYTGQMQPPGGVPGTTTNIPGYAVNTQNAESEYNKSDATTNYEITTRESQEVMTPGRIRRLTASVLVDGELTEDRLIEVRELVSSAIGFSEARGDSLVVKAMKFSTILADAIAEEVRQERLYRIAIGALVGVVLLIFISAMFYWWYRRRQERLAREALERDTKKVPTLQDMLTSPDTLAFQGEMAVLEEQLKAYCRSNPDEVANLVNEWISSDN